MPKHNEMHDIETLISMVKKRSAIYDYSCTEHKNKEYTDFLWKQIADATNMTPTLCKAKWLALRNSYSREIRNEKEANANPYGRRKRRRWYLAEDMAFLREYLNYGQQNKRESLNDEHIEIDDDSTNNDDETSSTMTIEKTESKYIVNEENDVKLRSSTPSQSSNAAFETMQQIPASTSTTENPIEDPFKEYPQYPKIVNRQEEMNELQEQNMTFFKSILPDILKLSERRQRLFKQEVLSVLNNSLDEQEMGS